MTVCPSFYVAAFISTFLLSLWPAFLLYTSKGHIIISFIRDCYPISTAPVLMLTIIVIVGTSLPTPSTSSTAIQKTRPPSTSTTQLLNHGLPKQPPPRPPLRVDPSSTQLILVGSSIMIPMSFVRLFPSPSLECYCNNVG